MNKTAKILFSSLSIVTSLSITSASPYEKDTQKTTFVARDHQHRTALHSAFHELRTSEKKKQKCPSGFDTKFQVMGFYNETQNSNRLGEIFGANGTNAITVGTPSQVAAGTADVENNLLLHYYDMLYNTLEGTMRFNPKHTAYGTIFQTQVHLSPLLNGLYFSQNLVFMDTKNDLRVTFENEKTGAWSKESFTLQDVLDGNTLHRNMGASFSARYNEQEALKYAKICGSQSQHGLSNIESRLGWHFVNQNDCHAGISIFLQTPTGSQPTAEYLWEPRLGSQHWGLGVGFDTDAILWQDRSNSLKILFGLNYLYQYEAKEKRTLGIKDIFRKENSGHALSQYYLLGKIGKFMLYPAANVLTKEVSVEPGSQIDSFLALNFTTRNVSLDIGYNLYWQEEEYVNLPFYSWDNGTYAIAKFTWQTCNTAFSLSSAKPTGKTISYSNIDTTVAQSPSMLSHSIFGSVGYIFKHWTNPLMLNIGASYEWGNNRGTPDSFTVWGKGGFAF